MKKTIAVLIAFAALSLSNTVNADEKYYGLSSCYYVKSANVVVNNTQADVALYDCLTSDMKLARFIAVDKASVANEYAAQLAAMEVDAASEFFSVINKSYFFKSSISPDKISLLSDL